MQADPTSKPPSLVEALRAKAEQSRNDCEPQSHVREHCYYRAANIAKPYAARLAALERVFEAARNVMISKEFCFLGLQDALAAVPEIKETPTDGS